MFTHNHFCLGLGTVATMWVGQRAKVRETLQETQGTRDGKSLTQSEDIGKGMRQKSKAFHKNPLHWFHCVLPPHKAELPELTLRV